MIEANIILVFVLLSYLPPPYRSNFMKDISSSLRIHELTLISSFMRHLRRLWRFGSAGKNGKLLLLLRFIVSWKLWWSICSLRWLKSKHNLVRSLIPRLSETLNKLLGEGLINFSHEFLKTSYDTDLLIARLKLCYCLIVYGKSEFKKYSVPQNLWRNFLLFVVW